MVTASHNPPQDNGYKVYLGDGSQIVPPADAGIAARIAAVGPLAEVPRGDAGEVLGDGRRRGLRGRGGRRWSPPGRPARRDAWSTPRCTGWAAPAWSRRSAARLPRAARGREPGRARPGLPDGRLPQPGGARGDGPRDGPGRAGRRRPASSPTTPTPTGARSAYPAPHGWRMLRGDEVGALLGDHLLRSGAAGHLRRLDRLLVPAGPDRRGAGQPYERDADRLQVDRPRPRAWRSATRRRWATASTRPGSADKDGISALLLVAELAAELKARGRTLRRPARRHRRRYGVHATDQLSVRVTDLSLIDEAMGRLRRSRRPARRARGRAVEDLAEGSAALPPTDGLRYGLADGARVVVRPSGTEPKIKCYLEVVVPVEPGAGDSVTTGSVPPGSRPPVASTRSAATSPLLPGSEPYALRSGPSPHEQREHETRAEHDEEHYLGLGPLVSHRTGSGVVGTGCLGQGLDPGRHQARVALVVEPGLGPAVPAGGRRAGCGRCRCRCSACRRPRHPTSAALPPGRSRPAGCARRGACCGSPGCPAAASTRGRTRLTQKISASSASPRATCTEVAPGSARSR